MKNTPIKATWIIPVLPFSVVILLAFVLLRANAAEPEDDAKTEELAKESQNPIANLISVPFQNNFNFGIGPKDATQWDLNVQPVIPITLNKEAASDERWTVPIGAGVGKILKLGKLPINTSLQAFYNAVTPNRGGADWQLRFQVQFLFPK